MRQTALKPLILALAIRDPAVRAEGFAHGVSRMTHRALSAVTLAALVIASAAHAEPATPDSATAWSKDFCGGVLMTIKTTPDKHHKAWVHDNGFYKIDGGLVLNGKSTCTSISIECAKADGTCRAARAVTAGFIGPPEVLGVFLEDDYKITEWTADTITAMRHSLGDTYLHIVINDQTPDDVRIINTSRSLEDPNKWATEVLTVENDPARLAATAQPK
jgi:hypothetical protein